MKQKIYIPQPIAAAGEDYLIEKGYEIVRGSGKTDKESIKNDIAVCDAMIQRTAKVDKEILEAGKNLKIIARHGAGYDNLDWKAANELGIYTTYSPDTTTLSVAEFTITVILNLAKRLKESEELVKEERDMPPEYAGLTREELEKQLTVEIKDKSWEEEKEGLVKITLESFSEDKIVIRKVYNKSSEQGYILRLKDGEVVIYRKDEKEPFEKTGLKEENLSKQDKKILQGGYAVRTEKELYSVLENFSS